MAESTLSDQYDDLMLTVAVFLGYGRNSTNWGATRTAQMADIIKSGLRQFYYPPMPHAWSFLKPVTTLITAADDYDYDLPDDYGGINGSFTYSVSTLYPAISVVGEGQIRDARQGYTPSGRPKVAAIRPKTSDGTEGQRFEVIFWPTPNGIWTLGYCYNVLPDKIQTLNPYHYGGMAHAETVLASCLSIAEERMNDEHGIHYEKFQERLAASIEYDLKSNMPDYFGYNGDGSFDADKPERQGIRVSFNGVFY